MKKLIFILLIFTGLSCYAQTGTGWQKVRYKANFVDTININGIVFDSSVLCLLFLFIVGKGHRRVIALRCLFLLYNN